MLSISGSDLHSLWRHTWAEHFPGQAHELPAWEDLSQRDQALFSFLARCVAELVGIRQQEFLRQVQAELLESRVLSVTR